VEKRTQEGRWRFSFALSISGHYPADDGQLPGSIGVLGNDSKIRPRSLKSVMSVVWI
jgi:hypothetical protein